MKAIVGTQYESPAVLQVQEVAKPTPKDNDVRVKVHAVSVNASDLPALRGKPFLMRLLKPLAEMSNSFSRVMRYAGTYPGWVGGMLPSMYVQVQLQWG